MWNRLASYVPRLFGRDGPSPESEDEASCNINLCYQMVEEEADSGSATGGDYDVFLSFRGSDTRKGFADCLYVFMCQAGIRVYRDKEELQQGEKISAILRAVKSSQIFIPIFSKDYASSKWCLEELACMVESTRLSMGKTILPIFYDVDPSDVKLVTKLYESGLNKHEERYGSARVKPWKDALTTVGSISGWHLKDQRHGDAMREITQTVLQKITIRKRYLPTDLVGIDDRIEDIKKLLNCLDTSDVRFVIIHGMCGIGKTTLAKAVFNQLSHLFEGHSFLSNIQESSPYGGIVKMQRKLVADLFHFTLAETFDFEDGNNFIKKRLPNKRVLLVFDGMDERDQFMQFAKHCTLCGPGSRIIITTRDKSVFPVTKVERLEENISTGSIGIFLYELKDMHFDHALQLFNKLAFNTNSAPSDLYDISRQIVELTGGLPLALELIGSHLRDKNKAMWISTLKKLEKVPHQEVQQKLKISYDALEYQAKQIFLDIACFFVNKKISNAMYMWEACDLFPEVEIDILINKSFIKIVDRDRIMMHNQLRDLGRKIVREENIGKPGERSRLGFLEMALDIVRTKKGTENVVALTLWRSTHNFTREDFANLMKVRFLELDGGNFAGNFEDILSELRWLCWRNCPPKLQAKNFMLNHLVVLKLSGDITSEEWSRWVEIMVASKLKVLKIAGSKSLKKTPCFSKFMSLERWVLKDFPRLTELDCSIGKLERLIYMKIKWCPRLRGLPEEIGHLAALTELVLIQGFSVRYLPDSIGNLGGLSRLVMEDSGLVELPDTIKGLVDLKFLCLANCTSLKRLPDAVGELKLLTELDLSGTTIQQLPHSIWNRIDLTLQMNSSKIGMQLLKDVTLLEGFEDCWDHMGPGAVPKSAPKMLKEVAQNKIWHWLEISYEALEYGAKKVLLDIACFFVNMKEIKAMHMWEACGLFSKVEIDVLVQRSWIKIVDHRIWMHDQVRYFAREIVRRENIRKFGDRSRLWLPKMAPDIIQAKRGAENVEALTSWKLRHNYNLTPEDCANLRDTRFLELDGQNFAGNFKIILPELKWLCWRNCPPKLQANNFVLNQLVVLKLSGDFTVEDWSKWVQIMVASKLKVLNLAGSKSFIKTPCFSEFMSLERLVLKDLPSLVEIDQSIGKLERLIYLKIKCCPLLRELPQEIGCLSALRDLILIQCHSVCYLPDSIGNLKLLSRLIMEDTGLVELPDTIKGLVDLEQMCLANCRSLNSLSDAVGELKSLTELDLSGTTIEELPPSLWRLEDLTLWIHTSKIEAQLIRYMPVMQDLEDRLDLAELEPDDLFESAMFSVSRPYYPLEILSQDSRKVVTPRFHQNHLSGRGFPKILTRVIFSHGDDLPIDIAAEVPLWDTGIMTSYQPIRYIKNLMLMLVIWWERKLVSKGMHEYQRKDEQLLCLEFCDRCMCITSEVREFSDSPLLETSSRFSQLSIAVSMTLHEPGRSDQIGCRVETVEILSKFSSQILRSTNLLLKVPWSSKKLPDYIEMSNSWDEEATQVQGSASRGSFKNCRGRQLRKTRGVGLRAKGQRNLTLGYLDKLLLAYTVSVCVGCCILMSFIEKKLDYCGYTLEEARPLLDRALDVGQKIRLVREFARVVKWLRRVAHVEIPEEDSYQLCVEMYYQLGEEMYTLLLHWYRRNRRRGRHHHRTWDADFWNVKPNWRGHCFY